jgi:hypothetical protein
LADAAASRLGGITEDDDNNTGSGGGGGGALKMASRRSSLEGGVDFQSTIRAAAVSHTRMDVYIVCVSHVLLCFLSIVSVVFRRRRWTFSRRFVQRW